MRSHQYPIGLIVACVTMILAFAAPAAGYPEFGRGVDGNCFFCHSTIVNNRMELFNFAGIVDPVERQGVPDQGPLKYYTVQAGQSVGMSMRATNGEENYAFQIIGFDEQEVTQGGTLTYHDDPAWMAFRGNHDTYFVRADGPYDGYDWGTSDPTEVTYDLHVDGGTPPGYYLLQFALVGRDPMRDGWYHSELFYLEVRSGSPPLTLDVDATCPGGGPIRVSWSNATPGGQVALLFARNTGNFPIPPGNPCAGTPLGLGTNQLQVGFQGGAGANGSRTINANTGPGVCGGYFQLLDLPTCRTSNVVRGQ